MADTYEDGFNRGYEAGYRAACERPESEHRHLGHELRALIHWAHDQGGYWVLDKCQPELDALVRAARKEGMPPLDAIKFNNMPTGKK
jgi:hypothetical protein